MCEALNEQTLDTGIRAVGNRPGSFSRDLFLGQPSDRTDTDAIAVGFNWSHSFNGNWTISHQFNYRNTDSFFRQSLLPDIYDTPLQPGRTALTQDNYTFDHSTENYFTSLTLTGKFDTFGLKHTMLIGGDYYRHDFNTNRMVTNRNFDISNPIYSRITPEFTPSFNLSYNDSWYGIYIQDQIKLPYGFNLMGGIRYDYADAKGEIPTLGLFQNAVQQRVSPRVGVLWELTPQLSLYGHYSEGFGSNNIQAFNSKADGKPFAPETAAEWEIGAKTALFDNRLTGSVSYFNITKSNIATPDQANPGFSVLTGEVLNRGVEIDVSGEILQNWNIIGSYAYIDSEITKDNTDFEGNRWPNTPTHSGSLWSTFTFDHGFLNGLKLGGGMVARGQRQGHIPNLYKIPGYVTLNMMASYEWKIGPSKITAQLNANNILDKTYFTHSNFYADQIFFGAPRSFIGSLKLEF